MLMAQGNSLNEMKVLEETGTGIDLGKIVMEMKCLSRAKALYGVQSCQLG